MSDRCRGEEASGEVTEPFLGQVSVGAFDFAPRGWALCNGQLLPINQNQALFSLLGTTFGGDGRTTFALPDLRGRVPIHVGSGHTSGERGGETQHTLTATELPAHVHMVAARSADGDQQAAAGNVLATTPNQVYDSAAPNVSMTATSVASVGGSQAHANMQPYLVVSFFIALQGIFPSPN